MDAAEATRHHAFRTGVGLVMAAGLFAAQAQASVIVADAAISIFLGRLVFLAPPSPRT